MSNRFLNNDLGSLQNLGVWHSCCDDLLVLWWSGSPGLVRG